MFRRLTALAAGTALVLVASPAAAASAATSVTYVWVGSAQDPDADNHSWGDPRNWSPSGVPGNGDSVVVAPPNATHCAASVDGVPELVLTDLTIALPNALCGTTLSGGPVTVTGAFSWDGGTLNAPLTLAAGSTGSVTAGNDRHNLVNQPIAVNGSLTLSGLAGQGYLFFTNDHPVGITVADGGVLRSSGSTDIRALSCCNAPAKIVNNGTLEVDSGTLHAGGIEIDQNGTLSVARTATLDSAGGLVFASAGAQYAGAGTWTIETGARAHIAGRQTLGKLFHLQLGTIGATAGAVMGGNFTLGGTGTFDWSAGTLGGRVTVGPTAHVDVSGTTVNNGRRQFAPNDPTGGTGRPSHLVNHGTMTVDHGAAFTVAASIAVDNAADGDLVLAAGTVINGSACCVAPAILVNEGALKVGTSSAATPVTLPSMRFQDDGGTVTIVAGRTLQLAHGPRHLLSGTPLGGGGTLQIAGATDVTGVTLSDGTVLELGAGGSLDGTATVDGDGAVDWDGGAMSGNLVLDPAAGVQVGGAAAKSLAPQPGSIPSTVEVRSSLAFAAGTSAAHNLLDLGTSALVLSGATSVPAFVEIRGGSLTNNGRLTVDAGADHADRSGPSETTVNRGTLAVVSGTLAVANTYQQPTGRLAITTTGVASGRVTVLHAASVAGTVRMVTETVPAPGATLTVLTSNALTWSGSVVTTGAGADAGHWVAAPTATALTTVWQAG